MAMFALILFGFITGCVLGYIDVKEKFVDYFISNPSQTREPEQIAVAETLRS